MPAYSRVGRPERHSLTISICGINNCDSMKKACAWLDSHGVDYWFHDYKSAGIDRDRLERWSKKVRWEALRREGVNRVVYDITSKPPGTIEWE